MKTIGAAKFKEQCLLIIDHLEPEGLVITKRGKPVAKIIPYPEGSSDSIGCLAGELKVTGDIFSTGLDWNSDS